jgi:sarcosine oxidase subunit gamma
MVRILPAATRFVFQGGPAARAALYAEWGVPFAETACRAYSQGGRATLWLGPEEYLLWQAARDLESATLIALEHAVADTPHSLVDVSHRQIALQIAGPQAENLLNGACPLDLHIEAFPIDMCTRTVFAKADIVLWRTQADTFHLEVWRSFAPYVIALLSEIDA